MDNQWETVGQLFENLGTLLAALLRFALRWWLAILWLAWWLWGVKWKRVWPVLAQGAWAPVVLLVLVVALAWSQIAPGEGSVLGLVKLPTYWWHLSILVLLACLTMLCGWLQKALDWEPAEIDLEPPQPAHDHGHGHH